MQLLEALNYMGPNRRFECTAIEILVHFDKTEAELIGHQVVALAERLRDSLLQAGVALPADFPTVSPGSSALDRFGSLFCQACIALQRWAGHDVNDWCIVPCTHELQRRFVYQHEERVTAEKAGDIVMLLLSQLAPGLSWQSRTDEAASDPATLCTRFRELAVPLAMPQDTLDIIAAARSLDVPCVKLERDPYHPLPGPHRIRANSLLMLGHSRHRQIVDGTICVTRSHELLPLVHDHGARLGALQSMGLGPANAGHVRKIHKALMAGQVFICLADGNENPDEKLVGRLEQIAALFPAGLLLVTFDQDTPGGNVRVMDLDFAPRLDELSQVSQALRLRATRAFVSWIFPPGVETRIPVIAVTGTNGKSTTTTMIDHVLRHQGLVTGVAYSSGVKINGVTTESGDLAGLMGHYRVFESPEPEIAVLETARGGVVQRGFSFDWCNTGVCLNVADDHIGLLGIDSIEQMAGIKCSIIARARDAVVLNADDSHCRAMIEKVEARKICLVSVEQDIGVLRGVSGKVRNFCTVETVDSQAWIVFYRHHERIPVVQVDQIPATLGGRLVHNVINAAHAAAACLMTGIAAEQVTPALLEFTLDADTLLGRWNMVEGLPFMAVFDYAHNEHGIRYLVAALKQFDVSGTRRIAFAYTGDRGDESVRNAMRVLSSGFDRFLVTEFEGLRGRARFEMRQLVADALIQAGVERQHIKLFDTEDEAVRSGLEASRPGDLLVVLGGKLSMRRIWQQMCEFSDRFQLSV